METSNQSYAYQGRSVGHSTSQPARFNHQCLQCNRFITVIDALCDRIKNLESQVARAFADQTSAEKALLCILRLRERDDQVSLETSYKTAEGITKDAASLSQSFSSDDTLAEPVAEDRACSSAAIPCNDVPLIDLFESKINESYDAFSEDNLDLSRSGVGAATDLLDLHSYSYIHHFANRSVQPQPSGEIPILGIGKTVKDSQPDNANPDLPVSLDSGASQETQCVMAGVTKIQLCPEKAPYPSSSKADLGHSSPSNHVPAPSTRSIAQEQGSTGSFEHTTADQSRQTDETVGISKHSKPTSGLEHSIWASKVGQKDHTPLKPALQNQEVVNDHKTQVKVPLWARNRLAGSLEEFQAQFGRVDNKPSSRDCFRYLARYRITYVPTSSDIDVYRTVIISGLKPNCSVAEVLGQVRGGIVVDAKMLNTSKILGSRSALVTFLDEYPAMRFEDYALQHPFQIGGLAVTVRLLPTPTWPLAKGPNQAIRKHGHSRCLKVHNCPKTVSAVSLRADLEGCSQTKMSCIEDIVFDHEGAVEIRFTSIAAAQQALNTLMSLRYRRCKIEFAEDPCAQPLGQG